MSHIVRIKKTESTASLKEMFQWCSLYTSNSAWGTEWWTEKNNTEYHFLDADIALMFLLTYG